MTNAEMIAAIERLERRCADLEGAAVVFAEHIEALEEKPARIASLLQKWTPDASRPM
jgi:prefoldin subunit 5